MTSNNTPLAVEKPFSLSFCSIIKVAARVRKNLIFNFLLRILPILETRGFLAPYIDDIFLISSIIFASLCIFQALFLTLFYHN